jgi:hypothetical protein
MKAGRAQPKTALWWVGIWATIWWGVSCAYPLLLIWLARSYYVHLPEAKSQGFASDWAHAIGDTFGRYSFLWPLLIAVVAVWLVGGAIWLRELKRAKITYKSAFKDLFLTIRR